MLEHIPKFGKEYNVNTCLLILQWDEIGFELREIVD